MHKRDDGADNEKTVFESIIDARLSSSVCQTPQPKKKQKLSTGKNNKFEKITRK